MIERGPPKTTRREMTRARLEIVREVEWTRPSGEDGQPRGVENGGCEGECWDM